jgi:ComF family protein
MKEFRWANGRTCEKCGKILQDNYVHDICIDCRESHHYFEKGYTCVQYGIRERELLLALKYGGQTFIGESIADVMADRLKPENLKTDLIIPVPMHIRKRRKRGYNQAEVLAECLSKKMGLPYSSKLLLRTEYTPAMSGLSSAERRLNMEHAFCVAENAVGEVKGKKILLVDDIYTTGSTASACAQVLMERGADEVRVITFAAGANAFPVKI